jgi:DNA-binding LacI/PurR family transcriptional regulator
MNMDHNSGESDFSRGRPTIYTIAEESGVSPATVSRIVNGNFRGREEVRRRVQEVIERHGYQPNPVAKRLSGKKVASRMVGIMAPFFIHPFFVEVLKGIYGVFHGEGYHIVLYDVDSKSMKKSTFALVVEEGFLDGLLLVNMRLNAQEYAAITATTPVVLAAAETDFADSVVVDNYLGIVMGLEYAYRLGHRHIAFINNEKDILESRLREQAFRDQTEKLQLPCKIDYRGVDHRSGYLGARNMIENNPETTCLMYYSDLMAFGGLDYLNENGLAKKISIIGFDGFEMTFHAQLTSVVQPMEEMGARTAQMLVARIQGGSAERQHVVLKPWLFEGQTCTPKAPCE